MAEVGREGGEALLVSLPGQGVAVDDVLSSDDGGAAQGLVDGGHLQGVCNVQCVVCIRQRAVCSVQCAVCSVQCAVCSVQCAVCSVQRAVCSVQ